MCFAKPFRMQDVFYENIFLANKNNHRPGTGVHRPRTLDKRKLDANRWCNSQSMRLICGWSCDDVNLSTLGGEGVVAWRERDKSVDCQIFT